MPFFINIACIEDHHDYSYIPIFLGTLQTKHETVLRYIPHESEMFETHHGADLIGVKSEWRRPGMAVIL